MNCVPESRVEELLLWIAHERDAAWAAKLAVLRAESSEDIAHFGACVREHDRHADELEQLVRAIDRTREIRREPSFVTRDAFIIGALDDSRAVRDAVVEIERARIARYEGRRRDPSVLDALLERHLQEARARLASLRRRCAAHRVRSGAAA